MSKMNAVAMTGERKSVLKNSPTFVCNALSNSGPRVGLQLVDGLAGSFGAVAGRARKSSANTAAPRLPPDTELIPKR